MTIIIIALIVFALAFAVWFIAMLRDGRRIRGMRYRQSRESQERMGDAYEDEVRRRGGRP